MPTKVVFYDKHGKLLPLDDILPMDAHGLKTHTHWEHFIELGQVFTVQVVDTVMSNADLLSIAFKTPKEDVCVVRMIPNFCTLVGGSLVVYEDATWDSGTGAATAVNNRLRHDDAPVTALLEDDTATPTFLATGKVLNTPTTPAGTAIWTRYAWGERGKIGGEDYRADNKLILEPDTQYAVVFTAIGDSNKAQVWLNWAELKKEIE